MILFLLGMTVLEWMSYPKHLGLVSDFMIIFHVWIFGLYLCLCTMCVPSACRARRGHRTPWNWSRGWLWVIIWVLGIEPGSLKRQPLLLTAKPSLDPVLEVFLFLFLFLVIWDRVSLCSLGCPWGLCATQTGLELTESHLPLHAPCPHFIWT